MSDHDNCDIGNIHFVFGRFGFILPEDRPSSATGSDRSRGDPNTPEPPRFVALTKEEWQSLGTQGRVNAEYLTLGKKWCAPGFQGHSHISHSHVRRQVEAVRMMAQSRVAARPADLPNYDNPPVNEVVIGIQFDRMAITGAHIGLFWEDLRDEFPKASEQPPLERRIESFQPLRFSAPILDVSSWPGSRHWLTSEDDVQLIQVQADRLLYNWRRGHHNATYPHFESLQEKFWSIAEKMVCFP